VLRQRWRLTGEPPRHPAVALPPWSAINAAIIAATAG
jgi:hypothetical protein